MKWQTERSRSVVIFTTTLKHKENDVSYKEPEPFVQVGDTILTNSGKELEDDQEKLVMVPERDEEGELTGRLVEEFNGVYHTHRNARSRVWLPNGKVVRILVEVDGVVNKVNPLAVMPSNCKINELQPAYVRVRMEDPTTRIPTGAEIV